MTAQPADRIPASGPDIGSYEVIHLGGQAAVVVPVSDFLRLRRGRYRLMYDITAETMSVWHLGRSWAGS